MTDPTIKQTGLGMQSDRFRIVVCGKHNGVLLGAFPMMAVVQARIGAGFVTPTRFQDFVDRPRADDFQRRVRVAAQRLLELAERNTPGKHDSVSEIDLWEALANDALREQEADPQPEPSDDIWVRDDVETDTWQRVYHRRQLIPTSALLTADFAEARVSATCADDRWSWAGTITVWSNRGHAASYEEAVEKAEAWLVGLKRKEATPE